MSVAYVTKDSPISRNDLSALFAADNIETRPIWKPMHLQPIFKGYQFFGDNIAEQLFEQGICLPSGSNLTNEDRDRILAVLQRTL